jgi:hypothetical protein
MRVERRVADDDRPVPLTPAALSPAGLGNLDAA